MEWESRTATCRLKLQKDGYSSGVTSLTPAPDTFSIRWGEPERDDLTRSLLQSEATIRFIGDSDGENVSEVFNSSDREWRVVFERDTGSGFSDEWYGFLKTDEWRDNPRVPDETITLSAIGGLQLLQTEDYDRATSTAWIVIRELLQNPHDLDVRANMQWYPYRAGNQISGDTLPLRTFDVDNQAFDELKPIEGEEGFETTDQRSKHRALEALLERFGMQGFQSRGEWYARQRIKILSTTDKDGNPETQAGEIKEWATNDSSPPRTVDLTRSLPTQFATETPRGLVQKFNKVESVHKYQGLGELVQNESFESSFTGWSTSTPGNSKARVQDYGNTPLRVATQNDSKVANLRPDYDPNTNTTNEPVLEQELPIINHFAGPSAAYQVRWDLALETKNAVPITKITAETEGGTTYYAKPIELTVQEEVDAADDGSVVVDPLPGTNNNLVIPEGSQLFVLGSGFPFTTISLSENARAEDEILRGGISSNIKTDNNQRVVAWVWDTQDSRLEGIEEIPNYPNVATTLTPQRVVLPQVSPTGDQVTDNFKIRFSATLPPSETELECWVDHVSVNLLINNQPVSQTSYITSEDQAGENLSLKQLIGDGPTERHPRGLDLTGVDVTQDWQNGAYGSGDSRSGQLIEEITAETAMRQQRDVLKRFTERVPLLPGDEIWPHDVFTIDGDYYSVSFLERTFNSEEEARLELTQLKDASTSGLTRTFSMESEDPSGGTAGGTTTTGGGGIASGGIEVIELDASGGASVTETLPAPFGQSVVVVRIDDDTNGTATIQDPNSNDIVWPGRDNASSFDISPLASFLLTGDTASTPQWYVENPAVYEIGSFVPGNVSVDRIMLRHKVEHDLRVEGITVDAESDADNDVVLRLKNSGTTITDVTVSGGTSSASTTFSVRIPAGNVLKVLCKDADKGLSDVSLTFDAIRD